MSTLMNYFTPKRKQSARSVGSSTSSYEGDRDLKKQKSVTPEGDLEDSVIEEESGVIESDMAESTLEISGIESLKEFLAEFDRKLDERMNVFRIETKGLVKETVELFTRDIELVKSQLCTLRKDNDEIKKEVQLLKKPFDQKCEEIDAELNLMECSHADIVKELDREKRKRKALEKKHEELEQKTKELEKNAVESEQQSRKSNARIFNLPIAETDLVSSKQVVVELLRDKLGLQSITVDDIDVAHRLPGANKPEQMIVKFFATDTKQLVMKNRSKLKGSKVVIKEDLCVPLQKLLNRVSKNDMVEDAWAWNGRMGLEWKDIL